MLRRAHQWFCGLFDNTGFPPIKQPLALEAEALAFGYPQVRGFIVFVLIFLAFWIKLRMEDQWMRSQFGEAYATYARQTAALVPYLL
jgi:protein-S-isoprenylcysteine O-methyltransferase Ste14